MFSYATAIHNYASVHACLFAKPATLLFWNFPIMSLRDFCINCLCGSGGMRFTKPLKTRQGKAWRQRTDATQMPIEIRSPICGKQRGYNTGAGRGGPPTRQVRHICVGTYCHPSDYTCMKTRERKGGKQYLMERKKGQPFRSRLRFTYTK